MKLVKAIRHTLQFIRFIASMLLVIVRFRCYAMIPSLAEVRARRSDWPWIRMHILRRDEYSCRVCGRKGDEITLQVYPVQSVFFIAKELITLCAGCHHATESVRITADNVPEFLHCLWNQLRPTYQPATSLCLERAQVERLSHIWHGQNSW